MKQYRQRWRCCRKDKVKWNKTKVKKKCKYCSDGRISLVNLFHAGIKMPVGECVTFSPEETYYRKTKGSIGIEIKAQDGSWEMHGEMAEPKFSVYIDIPSSKIGRASCRERV